MVGIVSRLEISSPFHSLLLMSSYTDLCFHSLFIFLFLLESIKKELSLVILKLHLVDLLFRRWPRVPLPYYWYGYERDFSGHPRAKSGHLRAKSSTLTNNPRDQETQVAGSKALLTILARVKEEKPCSIHKGICSSSPSKS